MLKKHFIALFEYNDWANRAILDALKAAGGGTDRCCQLMTHLLSAQQIWLNRIAGTPRVLRLWDIESVEVLAIQSAENTKQWLAYWESFDEANDFDKTVSYKNSQGLAYINTVKDICTHLINHSTYHRAQINQLLRQNSYEPAITDYIAYRRIQTGQL